MSTKNAGIEKSVKGIPSVLFVCLANICRSPMAAALFRARLKNERPDWQLWRVDSAGTWALDGEMAAKNARLVMVQHGLDISGHRAKTVTAEMVKSYDVILTMEAGQKEALQIEFPAVADRVFLMSEMDGSSGPVQDPIGRDMAAFEETVEKIDQIFAKGMPKIFSLVEGKQKKEEAG